MTLPNLPNGLTLSRIFLVPILVVVLLTRTERWELIGAAIFAVAALTDWLDGYLAPRRQQVTTLGITLGPVEPAREGQDGASGGGHSSPHPRREVSGTARGSGQGHPLAYRHSRPRLRPRLLPEVLSKGRGRAALRKPGVRRRYRSPVISGRPSRGYVGPKGG